MPPAYVQFAGIVNFIDSQLTCCPVEAGLLGAAVERLGCDHLSCAADAECEARIADVCTVYRTADERGEAGQRTVSTDVGGSNRW